MRMNRVRAELEHQLRRSPTVPELARELGVDPEDVIETLASAQSYQSVSLDAPSPSAGPDANVSLADTLGDDDDQYALVEDIASLKPLLARLHREDTSRDNSSSALGRDSSKVAHE